MFGKIAAAGAGIAALLLLSMIVLITGGTAEEPIPPGGCGPTAPVDAGQKTATLTANQMAAARTIVATGKAMTITERGVAIAIGTAMQESTLDTNARNGRSLGLFQQQGALYADVQRSVPADSSRGFYAQLLQRVPNYNDAAAGSFADIIQTVQASGAGASKYAPWESWATALARDLFSGTTSPGNGGSSTPRGDREIRCKSAGGSGPIAVVYNGQRVTAPAQSGVTGTFTFPTDAAARAAAAALSYLGTTYAWGGGDSTGPTKGISDNGGAADKHRDYLKVGFDCSGLTEYAWAQGGITLPSVAREQQKVATSLPWNDARPGDLLFWGAPAHHVALYLGQIDGQSYMVESPQSGDVVKISPVRTNGDFQNTVVRPYQS